MSESRRIGIGAASADSHLDTPPRSNDGDNFRPRSSDDVDYQPETTQEVILNFFKVNYRINLLEDDNEGGDPEKH